MDAKPKSNKQKRLEKKARQARRAALATQPDPRAEAAANEARAQEALRRARERARDLPRFLERLASEAGPEASSDNQIRQLAAIFATAGHNRPGRYPVAPNAPAFRRLIEVCWERTDLLRGPSCLRFANALLALSAHARAWVRQPGPWLPRSHNADRQFDSLLRHLLALYEVPAFMNSAWLEGLTTEGVTHQRWFIHIAQGANMRTAMDLPFPLTRMQAHLYLHAPSDFDVLSALRWAQLRDMGADDRLVRSIVATRLGRDFEHEGFWITVMRWLVEQPMLDPSRHGPIIDYLHDQRFVASVPNPLAHLPGEPLLVPPHPKLTMKGRDPRTLLRAVAAWHRRLGRFTSGPAIHWTATGITPLRFEEGEGAARRIYTTQELTRSDDLQHEGRAMAHCVASYSTSCRSGRVSIWSLRVVDGSGKQTRLLTIEVDNTARQIVQARGRFNALPSAKDFLLLNRWTAVSGLTISRWVTSSR